MTVPAVIRAFRLPFLTASVLPYLFGARLASAALHPVPFLLGLTTVIFTHLSANLMNDYADHVSGIDDHDATYYGLFGGSKLIQEGRLSPRFFLSAGIVCGAAAAVSMLALACLLDRPLLPVLFAIVILLAWSYSTGPRLSHHGLGELIIFLLFGPVLVAGAAFLQAGTFPQAHVWLLGCPFGLLTAALLVANEIPDCPDDLKGGKRTLVGRTGARHGYLLFAGLVVLAFVLIIVAVLLVWLGPLALLSVVGLPLASGATFILRTRWQNKPELVKSSRLAVAMQAVVALILILDVWL